jgi:hypothetical protein
MGKMLMGTLTMAAFALLASMGKITGRGPEDKDLRAAMERTGWKPYSAYIPWIGAHGAYVPLRQLDPIIGQHAGMMADIVEIMSDQRLDWYEKLLIGPFFAVASNLGTRNYFQSMANFFAAFSPRSIREFEGESAREGLRGLVRGRLSSLVPALWSLAEKTRDPAMKAAWGPIDQARERVPGWASGLPNYRNKWADKRLLGWGWSSGWLNYVEAFTQAVIPLQVSTLVSDPLDRALLANQIRLSMPTRTLDVRAPSGVTGTGVDAAMAAADAADPYAVKPLVLDNWQYEKYVALAANNADAIAELQLQVPPKAVAALRREVTGIAQERLPASVPDDLYSVLLWATTTKRWGEGQPGPQGDREELLRRIDSAYRAFGREQLLANDAALRQRYLTGQALRQLQQTPLSQRGRMQHFQQRQLEQEERRLSVGGAR